jgi:hypothetical protein
MQLAIDLSNPTLRKEMELDMNRISSGEKTKVRRTPSWPRSWANFSRL